MELMRQAVPGRAHRKAIARCRVIGQPVVMQIRSARPGDGYSIAELNWAVHDLHVAARPDIFRSHPDLLELASTFDQWIDDPDRVLLLAEEPPEQVGFLIASYTHLPGHTLAYPASCLTIDQIAVLPAHRRSRLGSALVRAALDNAALRGVDRVDSSVWQFNADAQRFFRAEGFEATMQTMSIRLR